MGRSVFVAAVSKFRRDCCEVALFHALAGSSGIDHESTLTMSAFLYANGVAMSDRPRGVIHKII